MNQGIDGFAGRVKRTLSMECPKIRTKAGYTAGFVGML